jgi:hypothetical protein
MTYWFFALILKPGWKRGPGLIATQNPLISLEYSRLSQIP